MFLYGPEFQREEVTLAQFQNQEEEGRKIP
jgi:hypothetical protein